ncbi:MAG: hypothetical protein Kow0077_14760 [Anaerolineae bacterium]
MEDRILTLHPAGKQGVNIDRTKYAEVRRAILSAIRANGEIAFKTLSEEVGHRLGPNFDGSVGWYTTVVKLDLEARGLIERVPGRGPQRLRLVDDA